MMPHQTLHHALVQAIEPPEVQARQQDKRNRYDRMYLDVALRVAQMSHDRDTKVGGVLVKDNNIVSFGWNGTPVGFPNECKDSDGKTIPEVCHAEMNVLAKLARNGSTGAVGSTLYVTISPCFECAKLLLQSGVKRVVYLSEYRDTRPLDFLRRVGVPCELAP